MVEIERSVDVAAPPAEVFAAMTDWEAQGVWMLGTRVRVPGGGDGHGLGGRFEAVTGRPPLGFADPMEITLWDPPRRCDVRHLGRFVRGTGSFRVVDTPAGGARFVWSEQLDLPLGALGRLGFAVVGPVFGYGVTVSLRRFARWVEAGRPSR